MKVWRKRILICIIRETTCTHETSEREKDRLSETV